MIALRTSFEWRIARLRSLGWRGLLEIEQDTLQRLLKSTLAATLAWEAASLINSPRPVLACVGAILVVQVTVRASLARSIQLTVAVTFGLLAALFLGQLLGLHWWSIAVVVLFSLLAGEVLRLGPFSAQAAISGLLVVSLGSGYGYERAIDTVIGAAIGVVVNSVIAPPTYVQRASSELRRIGEDAAVLLADIGTGVSARFDVAAVRRWLEQARSISADAAVAEQTVAQGEESVRFNPRARGELDTLERLDQARIALAHAVTQARGIARTLLSLAEAPLSADEHAALSALGPVLAEAGRQVGAFGRLQQRPDSEADRAAARAALTAARSARAAALPALADLGAIDSARAREIGAILVDLDRLLNEADVDTGAHSSAVSIAGARGSVADDSDTDSDGGPRAEQPK